MFSPLPRLQNHPTPLDIVFHSTADSLVTDDDNGTTDIFLYDVTDDTNGTSDTCIYDVQAEEVLNESTTLVSQVESIAGDDTSSAPSISADGTLVVVQSAATNLVTDDENAHSDIFVYSVNSGNIRVVSTDVSTAGTGNSSSGSISPNRSKIVFESLSLNWEEINTAYDNNGQHFLVTNELESDADPTPSPTTSSNSQGSNHSSQRPFVCSASRPSSAPHLLTVDRLGNTAVLWITPVAG